MKKSTPRIKKIGFVTGLVLAIAGYFQINTSKADCVITVFDNNSLLEIWGNDCICHSKGNECYLPDC